MVMAEMRRLMAKMRKLMAKMRKLMAPSDELYHAILKDRWTRGSSIGLSVDALTTVRLQLCSHGLNVIELF